MRGWKVRSRRPRGAMVLPQLKLACGIGLLLLVLPAFRLQADEFTQTSHYSARLFSGGILTIDARVGDIHVTGWDEPRVEVDAEKLVRAGNKAGANPLFGRIKVTLDGRDKAVRLYTVYPSRKLWRPFRGESKLTVNFDIRMPYDAALVLHCVDGDVRVEGVSANEELRVNYGDVEIDVPSVMGLRSLYAHTLLGYVQSDLGGTEQDSAGVKKKVAFWNPDGKQEVAVQVRMGGVFIYSGSE